MEKEIIDRIIQRLNTEICLETRQQLAEITFKFELKKGEFLCQEGDICKHIYYVEKGLMRQFYRKKSIEVTEHLACDDYFCFSIESLIFQKPSYLLIDALEDTTLYGISYNRLMVLKQYKLEIQHFYSRILEELLIISQKRADSFRLESVKERYERFLKEHPKVVQRAPLYCIASYLQTTPESLSRARASIN